MTKPSDHQQPPAAYPLKDYPVEEYPFALGGYSHPITTPSVEAQVWFDRGLAWTYAYNHEEAVACFRRALEYDPRCVMASFGIAYASGPFYNRPWIRYTAAEIVRVLPGCAEAAEYALLYSCEATPVEQALAGAIGKRYQQRSCECKDTLNAWHRDVTDAMRAAKRDFPDDLDVLALFSEAAITCTPRMLWNLQSGDMRDDAHTAEVVPLLAECLTRLERNGETHAGVAHVWIYTMEMSPTPELGMKAADSLRDLIPDGGHLRHMPAHIDVLCGDYAQALQQSRLAVATDERFAAYAGERNFYTTARCHDLHLYMYAAMLLGQYEPATFAANRIRAIATSELMATSEAYMQTLLDVYSSMRIHALVRFGCWHELTDLVDEDDSRKRIARVMLHYGRGVAYAALGNLAAAREEQARFSEGVQNVPEETVLLSNPALSVLAVGESMLAGELEYRRENYDAAFAHLRIAVRRDDNLNYTEPWAWMHPPRHALGALLIEQGHYAEAEAVFRADLGFDDAVPHCCQHADNIWALTGLSQCLQHRDARDELRYIEPHLRRAQARADDNIKSACFCAQASCCSG
tara:strand:- start:2536 stop:4266 length:1731 start_codon:yes stop_codon:yes gene_type:complete